jgi:hypothetical protein
MTNRLTEYMLNKLGRSPEFMEHFVKIHEPLYNLNETDFAKLRDLDSIGKVGKSRDWLLEYIEAPLIEDNFTFGADEEDKERNKWMEKLFEEFGGEAHRFLIRNKLRCKYSVDGLASTTGIVHCILGEKVENIQQNMERAKLDVGKNYSNYKNMRIEERIEFIRKREEDAYKLLSIMDSNIQELKRSSYL